MKRGTKITLFIASMALTVGSLIGFAGPRHCGDHGMYRHCANWNDNSNLDTAKTK